MNPKPIFDAVRILLGRGFSQDEVDALDAAINRAVAALPQTGASLRTIGAAGIKLVQKWEGCAKRWGDGQFEAYPDPGSKDGIHGRSAGAPPGRASGKA